MLKYLSQMRPEKQRELVLLLLICLVVVFFAMMIPHYLNARLFNRVSTSVAIMAVLAIGQTLVVLTRNIDLSVGSIVGFTAYFVGQQLSHNNDIDPLVAVFDGRFQRSSGGLLPGPGHHCDFGNDGAVQDLISGVFRCTDGLDR